MMEVKRWQRKTWWLARYFELAVPMIFVCYVEFNAKLMGQGKLSFWLVLEALVGLVYMAALRDIVETTWRRQAWDWLMDIRHCLTDDAVTRLMIKAENPNLKLSRVYTLTLAVAMTILGFLRLSVISIIVRVIIAIVVGSLIVSHILMMRLWVRDEIAKIRHSP